MCVLLGYVGLGRVGLGAFGLGYLAYQPLYIN